MIIRAKNKELFHYNNLTEKQIENQKQNTLEADTGAAILTSYPRRIVCELTNACNLSCIMCGRNAWDFHLTQFKLEWLQKISDVLNYVEEVTLMGWGEPTVHPQFSEFLAYLNNYPVKKYFCTNGMKLGDLIDDIFEYHVDIIAISLDGSNKETNDRIRKGADFNKIVETLRRIVSIKRERGLDYPYMNFVFTAMEDNYYQIPEMVDLAAEIGLDEVKVVYFTSFRDDLDAQTLMGKQERVRDIFDIASKKADEYGIQIKLPYIQGEDPAGSASHRECYSVWRDLFIGSDGYVRPCMSTPIKFLHIEDVTSLEELWNHPKYQAFRKTVNDERSMPQTCRTCYQSSVTNWNNTRSFIQHGLAFAPSWDEDRE